MHVKIALITLLRWGMSDCSENEWHAFYSGLKMGKKLCVNKGFQKSYR